MLKTNSRHCEQSVFLRKLLLLPIRKTLLALGFVEKSSFPFLFVNGVAGIDCLHAFMKATNSISSFVKNLWRIIATNLESWCQYKCNNAIWDQSYLPEYKETLLGVANLRRNCFEVAPKTQQWFFGNQLDAAQILQSVSHWNAWKEGWFVLLAQLPSSFFLNNTCKAIFCNIPSCLDEFIHSRVVYLIVRRNGCKNKFFSHPSKTPRHPLSRCYARA